jgi:hypothetical protein
MEPLICQDPYGEPMYESTCAPTPAGQVYDVIIVWLLEKFRLLWILKLIRR